MERDDVTSDASPGAGQVDPLKAQVEQDVQSDIAERAQHTTPAEAQRIDGVAGQLRGKAIDDVVGTGREVGRARGLARVSQVVDYVFYVVYTLLAIRLVLALIAARSSNGFVQLIRTVTDPLYALFRGIVGSPTAGGSTLVLPIVIAIIAYALLHVGVTGLLRLIAHRKTEI